MSANYRVINQVKKMADAYDVSKNLYLIEKEEYYRIVKEEMEKDPYNGWIGYENPVDSLMESIYEGDDKEWVAGILADYIRLGHIVADARKMDFEDVVNMDYIETAKQYIA